MTASSAKCARTDAAYAAVLVTAIQRAHPRLTERALAKLIGISWRHLRTLREARKELSLPLQLQLESHLDPALVDTLRARYPNKPPPFWVARMEGKHHARHQQGHHRRHPRR